jgi:hypothetical protein
MRPRIAETAVLGSIEAVSGLQHPGSLIAGMSFVCCSQQFSITYAAIDIDTDTDTDAPLFYFSHSDPLLSPLHFLQENRGDRRGQP